MHEPRGEMRQETPVTNEVLQGVAIFLGTKTIHWYLANRPWVQWVTSGSYRDWLDQNYAPR